MFITMGISLYTSRIVLNALGIENFGIYNLVGGLVSLFAFVNAAMMAATQRFVNYELGKGDADGLSQVFKTAYIIHIAIASAILIIGIPLGIFFVEHKLQIPTTSISQAVVVLYFSLGICAIQILTLPFSSDIVAHEKINIFAWISIFSSFARLSVAFMIKISPISGRLVLYAGLLFILEIIISVINIVYCRKNFFEVKGRLRIYKRRLKEMGQFAMWALIGCTAGAFSGQGLNVLLGMFFPPFVNAARGIAVQVQSAISTFGSNINTAMTPQITQSYASGEYSFFFNILYRGSKYIFFMMALVAIPIMIRAEYILQIWLGKVPEFTVPFLKWIVCATLIETISFPLMRASDASGRIRIYHSVVGGILLMILPISYFVLKNTGNPVSVFIVYFCVQFAAWFVRLIILHHTVRLSVQKYAKEVMSRIVVIFLLSLISGTYLSSFIRDDFGGLVIVILITTIITGTLAYTVGLDDSERHFLKSKLSYIIKKVK